MKRSLKILLSLSAPLLTVFSIVFSLGNNLVLNTRGTELWTHYKGVAPGLSKKGTKEYWVSCLTSEHVFTEPEGATIQEGETLSRAFIDALPENDDRLVPSYVEIMGFEDGNVPSHVTKKQNISSLEIVNDGTEGSKCLKITVSGSDYGVYFSKSYLDTVFANPDIVAINFDAKGSIHSSNFRARIASSNITYENNNTPYGLDTEWKKFSFKRSYYEAYVNGDAMIYGGGMTSGNYVLIDNVVPVTKDLDSFGFENGYLDTSNRIYRSAGHSNNDPAPEQIFKLIPESNTGSSGYCELSDLGFDYTDKTEGNRSFKFTKTNGYVMVYLSTAIKTALGDNGYVRFDFKTPVAINSNPSVANIRDGQNHPLGGAGYQIPKDTWMTFTIPASTGITSDGRFLIIQGSTPGTMHFDNIRLEYHESVYNLSSLNRNIYIEDASASTLFPTKRTPIGVASVLVDGTAIDNSNVVSFDSTGLRLANSYLSGLSVGDHKFVISYYYTDFSHVVEETYYQNVYFGTLKDAVNISTSYGSPDYYTLPGNYTNLYRITANGLEIPFERIDGGSTYKVPHASLIEALPTSNGQKSSGSLVLFIFTINALYRLPITLSFTTANVKTVTQYDGEQMPAFYYSSTQHTYDVSTEYETYLSTDKLNECFNTGVDILYEQKLHVGSSATSLSTQLQYLLNNAAKLSKKVILSDDAFTELGRKTTSLIGTDITVGSATKHFNNTSELDAYVTSRLNLYINYSSCYGVNVGDEEGYDQLIHGYSDLMHSIHRCLTALNREDFYLNTNLQPMSATAETTTGGSGSGNVETDYRTYLNAYIQASGNDYISYDYYPLLNGNAFKPSTFSTAPGVGPYTIRNLLLVAQVAKENGLKVHVVTQTFSPSHSSNTLILNSEDVAYLNTMLLAFGVDQICYFTFYHRGDTGSESWNADGCVMTADGQRNDLYYSMQAQREQIRAFSPMMSNFEFEWFYIDRYNTSLINPEAYSYLYSNKPYSSTTYHQLQGWTVDKSWISLTGLYSDEYSQYMYTVQNIHKNKNQDSKMQSITLKFDSSVQYFAVYEGGSVRVVTASTSNSYKVLNLSLSSGHTAFVVPYN